MSRETPLYTLSRKVHIAVADRCEAIKPDESFQQLEKDYSRSLHNKKLAGRSLKSILGIDSLEENKSLALAAIWLFFKNGSAKKPTNEEKATFDKLLSENNETELATLTRLAKIHHQQLTALGDFLLIHALQNSGVTYSKKNVNNRDIVLNVQKNADTIQYSVEHDLQSMMFFDTDSKEVFIPLPGKVHYTITETKDGFSISDIQIESKAICDFLSACDDQFQTTLDAKIKFFADLFNELPVEKNSTLYTPVTSLIGLNEKETFEAKKDLLIGLMRDFPAQKNIFYHLLIDLCITHIETLQKEYEDRPSSPLRLLDNTQEKIVAARMAIAKLNILKEELKDTTTPMSPVTKDKFQKAAQKDRLGEIISAFLAANEIASSPRSNPSPASPTSSTSPKR